jgi:hypothetical protein
MIQLGRQPMLKPRHWQSLTSYGHLTVTFRFITAKGGQGSRSRIPILPDPSSDHHGDVW